MFFLTLYCTLLVLLASAVPTFAALVRAPYLQLVTPTSITIVWRTDVLSPSDSRVQYGTNVGNLDQTATGTAIIPGSNPNVQDHFITLTGLTPETQYFYNVGTTSGGVEGGGTVEHYFVTAPTVGSTTPFTAWILGDSGDGSSNQVAVRDAMLGETGPNPPDIILHMGDIVYEDGTDIEFTNNHFAVYQDLLRHAVLWPSLGNHEARAVDASLGTGPYYEAHVLPTAGEAGGVASGTEAYYSFDYGNVHFIALDSTDSGRQPGSAMLIWLEADLAATTQEWVIAFWHHPPYTKGTHDSQVASSSEGRHVDMRENVLPILEAGGVELVIGGHSHIYERSFLINGVYGFGTSPNFATPDFQTLLSGGYIFDNGDGDPVGDGAYLKSPGLHANDGTVYVVAGHGGREVGGPGGHPVMFFDEVAFGSCLLNIDGSVLTLRNVRSDGVITDLFSIDKFLLTSPPNQAPTIAAGPDQTLTLPAAATVDGTVSDDGLPIPPGAVTTLWSQVSGPGMVTFGDATVVDTTASFSVAGTYVLRLSANDGALSSSDEVTVTVSADNTPPSNKGRDGGGCSLSPGAGFDSTLMSLFILGVGYLGCRRLWQYRVE